MSKANRTRVTLETGALNEQHAEAAYLVGQGHGLGHVAAAVGVTTATVHEWIDHSEPFRARVLDEALARLGDELEAMERHRLAALRIAHSIDRVAEGRDRHMAERMEAATAETVA